MSRAHEAALAIALLTSTSALAQQHVAGGSAQLTTAGPGSKGAVAFLYKATEHGVPDNARVVDFELHKADLSGSPNPDCSVELWLKDVGDDVWPAMSTQTLADFQQGATRVFQGAGLALSQAMGFVRFQQTLRGLSFAHTTGSIAALVVTDCTTPRQLMWKGDALEGRGRVSDASAGVLRATAPFSLHRPQARFTWLVPGKKLEVRVGTTVIPNNGRFAPAMNSWAAGVAVPQHYQLWNWGQQPLTLGAIAYSAQSNLTASGAPSATTIAPGAFVTLDVTVTPTAAGAAAFDLTLPTDDPAANPMRWGFLGTATAAAAPQLDRRRVLADGTSVALADNQVIDLGEVVVGGAVFVDEDLANYGATAQGGVTVTTTTAGTGAATIEASPTTVVEQTEGRTRIRVEIDGPAFTVWVTVTTPSGRLSTVEYRTAGAKPEISLIRNVEVPSGTNDRLELALPAGTKVPLTYTVANVANAYLDVTNVTVTDVVGGEVVVESPTSFTLGSYSSVPLSLGVTSTAGNALSFTLHVANTDADERDYTVNASRAGAFAKMVVTLNDQELRNGAFFQVGPEEVKNTMKLLRTLVIRNDGDAPLTVSSVTGKISSTVRTGCAGKLIPDPPPTGVIAPRSSGTPFQVELDPLQAGQEGDCLFVVTIVSDDPTAMPFTSLLVFEPSEPTCGLCAAQPGSLLALVAVLTLRRALRKAASRHPRP